MPSKVRALVQVYNNQVYLNLKEDRLYRVVMTGYSQPKTYLARTDGSRICIVSYQTEEFARLAGANATATGGYQLVEDPWLQKNREKRSTPGHVKKSEGTAKLLAPLVRRKTPEDIERFIAYLEGGSSRSSGFAARAKEEHVGRKAVYDAFRRWLQRGMSDAAVSSDYPRSGRLTTRRERVYKKVPGRRSRDPRPKTIPPSLRRDRLMRRMMDWLETNNEALWDKNLPKDLGSLDTSKPPASRKNRSSDKRGQSGRKGGRSKRGARRKRSRPTLRDVVLRANYLLRCEKVIRNERGEVINVECRQDDAITDDQFKHFLAAERRRQAFDPGCGQATSGKRRRKTGHAVQHCAGPGHVFMVDATVADVYLLSTLSRMLVAGRPTVYFVIDVWSRMIVGIHVSFRPPSFEGAALALINMASPKAEFCAKYGFTITTEDWPCRHMPGRFHVDRGCEYRQSVPWRRIGARFGVGVDNSAPLEPFWRGIIERRFGLIPVIAQRNGYGIVEKEKQRGYDPAKDALWTRAEFMLELLRAIHLYHRTPIGNDLDAPADMVGVGDANTPLNLWNWGVSHGNAVLAACEVDDVEHTVLPDVEATPVTGGTLTIRKLTYIAQRPLGSGGGRVPGGNQDIIVRCNPDDLSRITLSGADDNPVYAHPGKSPLAHAYEASLPEIEQYQRLKRANGRTEMQKNEGLRMAQALNSHESMHASAERREAALAAAGKVAPDTKHMRATRRDEQEIERSARDSAGTTKTSSTPSLSNGQRSETSAFADATKAARSSVVADLLMRAPTGRVNKRRI
ncbi:transposase [Paraburkholderia guartelaensis]|uniref:Transposase n=1 Tax=Paraburkholderia guartelaensis TaxID=2546446 RepID=A0A4R5L3G2_9BURK|nr:DDE-type integrase/transposase/recombinase [Paraburkholderia guartelaensis]TDG02681.1 transposase [Paraburkholderia guartelaensis]